MYIVYKIFEDQSHHYRIPPIPFWRPCSSSTCTTGNPPLPHTYTAHACRCGSLESSPSVAVRERHVKSPGRRYRGRRVYCKRDACNRVRIMWKKRTTFLTILRRLAVLLEFCTEGTYCMEVKTQPVRYFVR